MILERILPAVADPSLQSIMVVLVPPFIDLCSEGVILLGSQSCLRMHRWQHLYSIEPYAKFICWMLGHGVPFHWSILLVNTTPHLQDISLAPLSIATSFSYGAWWKCHATMVDSRQLYVCTIMAMPVAHVFLLEGGLAWRLAHKFGLSSLIANALSGPSTNATVWL